MCVCMFVEETVVVKFIYKVHKSRWGALPGCVLVACTCYETSMMGWVRAVSNL